MAEFTDPVAGCGGCVLYRH